MRSTRQLDRIYPGLIQLHHPSGLRVNVQCFHSERLPDGAERIKPFWNGKSWHFELAAIKYTESGTFPIIKCRYCDKMWMVDWVDLDGIVHGEIKGRFLKYKANPV